MSFVYERVVRFAEVDAAQVMYFSRVYEIAHEAYEELMTAAGHPPGTVFSEGEWGMPLVHTEADYRQPWRLSERIWVRAEVKSDSGRSVEIEYRFVDAEGTERTRVGMRHAFVSLQTFRSCGAPEGLISSLKTLTQNR